MFNTTSIVSGSALSSLLDDSGLALGCCRLVISVDSSLHSKVLFLETVGHRGDNHAKAMKYVQDWSKWEWSRQFGPFIFFFRHMS